MSEHASRPFVSVVMPVKDEGDHVAAALDALSRQTYPADRHEVVVAVAPSRDGTEARVRNAAAANPHVRVVTNLAGSASAGLNTAVKESRGDIIVRVDARTIVASDYLEQSVRALEASSAAVVGGPMRAEGGTAFGRATALAMRSWLGTGGARFRVSTREELVDTVYLGAWRRDDLLSLGGFDESLLRNQDDELSMRIRGQGGSILMTPAIESTYVPRDTPVELWRQYFGYGMWKVPVLRKYAGGPSRSWQWRHVAPAAFVIVCVGGVFVPAIAHLAAGTFVALGTKSDWRARAWLPIALLIMPSAYGTGMLTGLYLSWRRRFPAASDSVVRVPSRRVQRLEAAYRRYERREQERPRWHTTNPGNRAMHDELTGSLESALATTGLGRPDSLRVLDAGTGLGATSTLLLGLGVRPRNLCGVDRVFDRLRRAKSALRDVRLQRGDIVEGLPYADGAFDLACAFTLFSSIERDEDRRRAARELARVVRPGGALVLYDTRTPNPFNARVRTLPMRRLATLWPDLAVAYSRSLTVLPPLVRGLGARASAWYPRLSRLPLLRTHRLVVLVKPGTSAVADAA